MATRSKMKSQYRKENADRRPHATAKHIRISSRKVKIVIDLIRGALKMQKQSLCTPPRRLPSPP